jgi:hypothetical protein
MDRYGPNLSAAGQWTGNLGEGITVVMQADELMMESTKF